ncbi:hypothetical protein R6Q59_036865 [Mikania micrantha]
MVRGKVELKKIENLTNRQVTFSKRRHGLLKKAYELSVLCDVDVALIIFSQKGKLYEFSSSNMQKIIQKYYVHAKKDEHSNPEINLRTQQQKHEGAIIQQKIQQLEASKRKLLGQDLVSCSLEEISEISSKLEQTLRTIRARKTCLHMELIENLEAKEKCLLEENARLCQEITTLSQKDVGISHPNKQSMKEVDMGTCSKSMQLTEVETDLFIGLPLP